MLARSGPLARRYGTAARGASDSPLAELADRGLGLLDRREGPSHIVLFLLRTQARCLGSVLDDDPSRPVAADECESVYFDRGGVGCETQIVASHRLRDADADVDPAA